MMKRKEVEFFKLSNKTQFKTSQFQEAVQAGFPSPAEDFVDEIIDLNEYFIRHPTATFIARVIGDSMIDAGIFDGDFVVVDRALLPVNNDIIIASIDGEFTIKRFIKCEQYIKLMPENINYEPIIVADEMELKIWGVVTAVLRKIK